MNVQTILTELSGSCAFDNFSAFRKAIPLEGAKLTHAEQLLSFAADERGSEAVVYTGMAGVIGGIEGGLPYKPPPPFHMVVNRPFFAAIVDGRTRAIVLVSSIVVP